MARTSMRSSVRTGVGNCAMFNAAAIQPAAAYPIASVIPSAAMVEAPGVKAPAIVPTAIVQVAIAREPNGRAAHKVPHARRIRRRWRQGTHAGRKGQAGERKRRDGKQPG